MESYHDAIGGIYRDVDTLLRTGDFAKVDEMLQAMTVKVAATPITLLLAYLTITLAARTELGARAGFYDRVREHLELVAPDRAARLLMGLK